MSLDSSIQIAPGQSSTDPNISQNHHSPPRDNEAPVQRNDTEATPQLPLTRSNRPSRACTLRASQRLHAAQHQQAAEKKQKPARKERKQQMQLQGGYESPEQCSSGGTSKIITSLVEPPETSQIPRWSLRSMWELASVLNFLHVFRPFLNITVEFSAEEFETALITPNNTLSGIHIPLLKVIPPVARMALTRDTWVTVLCRKLRDWWHWVAEGDLPIVASHGAEIDTYKYLDPGVRVVILKALCDIRVEQDDIRNHIDSSLKHGAHLSAFRKERIGGDSQGINYWYENDPLIGHRLYREIRKFEIKKPKAKGSQILPNGSYEWEAVATNFEEFQDVSEKLFSSQNRMEVSLGKKIKIDLLPEIEKEHKRKEKLLKKQHRQALLLDNFMNVEGLGPGRALRDRKPVTYTFDDYDRSINEAIKITKKRPPSPEFTHRREFTKPEASANGKWSGSSSPASDNEDNNNALSPKSPDYDDVDENTSAQFQLDRSNRRRQRPQRYSAKEYVEAVSDFEGDFDSDDDIVGEAIYDEEYLRKRKQRRKMSSGSEGDEEYHWEEDNAEYEEEEEEEEDFLSVSEDSDEPKKFKKLTGRTRQGTKRRSVGELQSGLRRSTRATKNRIDYKQYEVSESETDSMKPGKSGPLDDQFDASDNMEYSTESQEEEYDDNVDNDDHQEIKADQPVDEGFNESVEKEQIPAPTVKPNTSSVDETDGVRKRRFLDLNELAPLSGFDDGPNPIIKDDDNNDNL